MKNPYLLSVIFTIVFNFSAFNQPTTPVGEKAYTLLNCLNSLHYKQVELNDSTANKLFEKFIQNLDASYLFLIEQDVLQLSAYRDSLDDDIVKFSNQLIEETTLIFEKRLHQADSLVDLILDQTLNYDKNEALDLKVASSKFAKTEKELYEKWRKLLKSKILEGLFILNKDTLDVFEIRRTDLFLSENKSIAKTRYKAKKHINSIVEYSEGLDVFIHLAFLNAITYLYDPHTTFFTSDMKDEFQESLSKETYKFGIRTFTNKNDEIEIENIAIGGPAWRSGDLEIGDVIISVKPQNKDEIDLTYADRSDFGEILANTENRIIDFTVRKKNGSLKTVNLKKEKLKSENNRSRSFILNGDRKIGYIYLPSFYTSFGDINQSGAARDVLKDLIKLQQDSIKGIILDLRNNGGGSVDEAANIISSFLDKKTFAEFVRRGMRNQKLTNNNNGVIYKGPLIVLVNNASASASELVAAVFKIYNRAIIVGDNTFGKFTGQQVFPLRNLKATNIIGDENSLGFIKITNQKTYMVNGICYQSTGIEPDIQLPFVKSYLSRREYDFENALLPDTIAPIEEYDHWIASRFKSFWQVVH
jgi:carboxyl-terminal processing protease